MDKVKKKAKGGELKTVCAKGPVTKGIDIYHGDYISDIGLVIQSGVKFAFLKAWEYTEDASFSSRWVSMKKEGVIRGAYDFFHPSKDPIVQAKGFLNTFGGVLEDDDLPCALDFEVSDGVGHATLLTNALAWLNYVEAATKKTPILYMSSGFTTLDSRFTKYGIWIANYGVNCPHLPDALSTWQFWQGSGTGKVPGMRGVCDTDQFNGTLEDLKAFIQKSNLA